MSEHIKTGEEITLDVINHRYEKKYKGYKDAKWVSSSWLKELIGKIRISVPLVTSSDWIENGSANECLSDLLDFLDSEEKKQ